MLKMMNSKLTVNRARFVCNNCSWLKCQGLIASFANHSAIEKNHSVIEMIACLIGFEEWY